MKIGGVIGGESRKVDSGAVVCYGVEGWWWWCYGRELLVKGLCGSGSGGGTTKVEGCWWCDGEVLVEGGSIIGKWGIEVLDVKGVMGVVW